MSSTLPNGFSFSVRKSGEVEVLHHGRQAALLRAGNAVRFLAKAQGANDQELQHLMARVTGNYKRGNEKAASEHERNP
jgi:hypothetical protein